ncbi:MAG: excinuclease ABC subunit UvrA, partial [Candidatus Sungbacteria bacterium]|nr:excinuclease ABC subunit UvrA [Candidatus Sungbacteria bacterium]
MKKTTKKPTLPSGEIISIRGARTHNLKNIDVDIPKGKLVVITGLSGSGKSSLAFDTIYAEAERRYVESLSSYARQFLGVQEKPDVESIDGLSPAISIDQKSVSRNPRSTVGTITEIYDYLRILFARIGRPHCPECGVPVERQTIEQMLEEIRHALRGKEETLILAPLASGKKGEHRGLLEEARRAGFIRARLNGEVRTIEEWMSLPIKKNKKHSLEVVVDRLTESAAIEPGRMRDSVETALKIGKGVMIAAIKDNAKLQMLNAEKERGKHVASAFSIQHSALFEDLLFSERFACKMCGKNLPDSEPRTFSFNSPYGACPHCTGLGATLEADPDLVVPNENLSIAEGAVRPWAGASHRVGRQSWYWWILDDLATRHGFSLKVPFKDIAAHARALILFGEPGARVKNGESMSDLGDEREAQIRATPGGFEGVIPNLKRRWKETDSEFTRAEIEKYMIIRTCTACAGHRLRPEALAVRINGENIAGVADRTVEQAAAWFEGLVDKKTALSAMELKIAAPIAKEIAKRLTFLRDVGLDYLTLARESTTLSGGEAQRIHLATQIGSRLTGIIYILDEPSIGLHPRDNAQLITTLKQLRDLGNTVLVVEHDAETMLASDWIIDIGPGAGSHGGRIIFSGTPAALLNAKTSTADYLSGRKKIERPKITRHSERSEESRQHTGSLTHTQDDQQKKGRDAIHFLTIFGATEHNLKNITVRMPLGQFICITGVSGSGKSTLINDILAKALLAKLHGAHTIPGAHKNITGIEHLNKAIVVDQSPIGRTPRSNPATYTGAFGFIRTLFASTPEARARGYLPGRFSFNVRGGRCEACEGQGVKKIEMHFLPDVYIECEECRGTRYNREALEILYRGKTIAEVLNMPIEEALDFFEAVPAVQTKLATMVEVGLGYMRLGQPAPTLSGGEAQRIKLATELSRRDTGASLYILDEPTTGLHFDDIKKLLGVLHALVEKGNTVLVIEHNMD